MVRLFGSAHETIRLTRPPRGWYPFRQDIFITKSYVKAIDQPTQRCTNDDTNINECIFGFIEKLIGCRPDIQGSEFSDGTSCTTMEQLMDLANISRIFEEADGNDIYEATGCLASCEKNYYSLSQGVLSGGYNRDLHVKFKIMDRTYEEKEQYIIYDISSFIADVGGYMGLLLGCSLSSLYADMESFLQKFLCRLKTN